MTACQSLSATSQDAFLSTDAQGKVFVKLGLSSIWPGRYTKTCIHMYIYTHTSHMYNYRNTHIHTDIHVTATIHMHTYIHIYIAKKR